MKQRRRNRPPARVRWNANHKTVGIHLSKEERQRALALAAQSGKSLSTLFREAIAMDVPDRESDFQRGVKAGQEDTRRSWQLFYPLSCCGRLEPLEPDTEEAKIAIKAVVAAGFGWPRDMCELYHKGRQIQTATPIVQPSNSATSRTTRAVIPARLFDGIEGREEEKQLLERALRSNQPVHVLLVGDPGCGKSELLQRIGLPHSRYAVGGATSSSGMIDYLLEKPNTRNLVIDDLHLVETDDLYALYGLMESGVVNRMQHGAQQHEKHTVWVFAAANSVEKLPPAVASRFVIHQLPNYSEAETREIIASVLQHREKLSPARAREIAAAVAPLSRDPRDGIQVGRLAREREELSQIVGQVLTKPRLDAAGRSRT